MKILILGSGGREHAFAWKCAQDNAVSQVIVAPGNAGTANEAKCSNADIDIGNNAQIIDYVKQQQIDLVIVGPEAPLVNGVVDACRANGIAIWGPTQYCAQLEGSKAFAKHFLKAHNIPTSAYEVFTDATAAKAYLQTKTAPIVIKADGLAAGKGVIVALSMAEAIAAVEDMLEGNKFGNAGARVVIEDFLEGEEASFICMVDGNNILAMATSQDHKRIFEGDLGPNTGGMGAYSPAPVVTTEVHNKVMQLIIEPTVRKMYETGNPYTGFLYAGLMIDDQGNPKVIEFNCRFGDPETQPIMMRLQSSLVELVLAGVQGQLPSHASWDPRPSIGIVLAAAGYPEQAITGDEIHITASQNLNHKVFHAGTQLQNGKVLTSGGRVLCATALGHSVADAQQQALALAGLIDYRGKQYRTDIGYRAIAREKKTP